MTSPAWADKPPPGETAGGAARGPGKPLTVSEVTAWIKSVLEDSMPMCWVIGEISQYTRHTSGHHYFTLKDDACQLSAVMFKWQARSLGFAPEPGTQVMAYGHISVYERGGRYQLYVAQLFPAGAGVLAAAFERLKARLEAEGLFAQERKRPLPPFPRTVGVLTSPTGAAIRDIVQVLRRRAPGVQVILRPARVQGPGAAEEIARGIDDLSRFPGVDILIVGRGGGSVEDLWPFNEEPVVRAIYRCSRPVISAVGHETDYTLADMVADCRAPTPSAAAEMVAQEYGALRRRVLERSERLVVGMEHLLQRWHERLQRAEPERLVRRLQGRLEQMVQYVDERRHHLVTGFDWFACRQRHAFQRAATRLADLSPLSGLARGYALCERVDNGLVVRSSAQVAPGDRVRLRFAQGSAVAAVEETSRE
ncbi:MAG: exodeoxyribonuclease VII large subunit [Candidatus Latescibacterota bacterium]